jgi:hypothetical protein
LLTTKGELYADHSLEGTVLPLVLKWLPITLAPLGALLQLGILFRMKKRNLHSQFPVFFNYNIYVVVAVPISIVTYLYCTSQHNLYFAYWCLNVFLIGFEFALMYEVFVAALKPYSALIDLGKMIFRWAGVFLLFAAILTAFATSSPSANRLTIATDLLERSMRLMECGLLMLFLLFERKLGLSWRSTSMSIALGLGVTAATGLAILYLQAKFPAAYQTLGLVNNLCYFGALVYWFTSIRMPVVARDTNVLESPSRLVFQRWNEALVSYGQRGELAMASNSVESFLPGVEQTVERILARKMVQ